MVQERALLPDTRVLNDPLLEEVRRFYEEHHDGLERSRRRHRYFYDYLARVMRVRVPEGQRVLDLGCGTGRPAGRAQPFAGRRASTSPRARWRRPAPAIAGENLHFFEGDLADRRLLAQVGGPFDAILLVNVVTHLTDVQRALESLHPLCHPRTRVLIYSYSRLWQPLLRLAEVLGLKYRQPPEAWLPPEEIKNMVSLADFELVRDDAHLLCPLRDPPPGGPR